MTKVEIPLEKCAFWLDPQDNVHMALPNDHDGHFLSMYDGEKFYSNAYPKDVWEVLGWTYLDPVVRPRIADELAELE